MNLKTPFQTDKANQMKKDGYVLVKNLFSKSEIENLRKKIATLPSTTADAFSYDFLRETLLDERILNPLREVLGPSIHYFGDSAVRNESIDGTRCFHQDSQQDFEDPSKTDYPVVRMGLYLQDHSRHSGGLKVRKGSHRHVFLGRQNLKRLFSGSGHGRLSFSTFRLGKEINLEIETGDLVIWNLRTWHSGYAVRLKLFPRLSINPRLEKYIPKFMVIEDIKPRMAIFASFGAPSKQLEEYIADRSTNSSMKDHWNLCHYDDSKVQEECAKKNIHLRFEPLKQREVIINN